ncbi:MAG: SPASM domain-containing protein [Planctomycetes bacterium]|nr:SPASM domain-containing protein [Planctomycetota bacterium]
MENVKAAAGLAREKGFPLMLSAVFSTGLAHELDAFVRFAADLGADAVAFQNLHHSTRAAAKLDPFRTMDPGEISEIKEQAVLAAEAAGLDIHFDFDPPFVKKFNTRVFRTFYADRLNQALLQFPHFCHMAATYIKINSNGSVYPCCVGNRSLKMGNLNRNSFAEIWNGRPYRKLRNSMFTGKYPRICRNCKHLQRGLRKVGNLKPDPVRQSAKGSTSP